MSASHAIAVAALQTGGLQTDTPRATRLYADLFLAWSRGRHLNQPLLDQLARERARVGEISEAEDAEIRARLLSGGAR